MKITFRLTFLCRVCHARSFVFILKKTLRPIPMLRATSVHKATGDIATKGSKYKSSRINSNIMYHK